MDRSTDNHPTPAPSAGSAPSIDTAIAAEAASYLEWCDQWRNPGTVASPKEMAAAIQRLTSALSEAEAERDAAHDTALMRLGQIEQLRAALIAKDAELARLREEIADRGAA